MAISAPPESVALVLVVQQVALQEHRTEPMAPVLTAEEVVGVDVLQVLVTAVMEGSQQQPVEVL
jgi:hypothetical protein